MTGNRVNGNCRLLLTLVCGGCFFAICGCPHDFDEASIATGEKACEASWTNLYDNQNRLRLGLRPLDSTWEEPTWIEGNCNSCGKSKDGYSKRFKLSDTGELRAETEWKTYRAAPVLSISLNWDYPDKGLKVAITDETGEFLKSNPKYGKELANQSPKDVQALMRLLKEWTQLHPGTH